MDPDLELSYISMQQHLGSDCQFATLGMPVVTHGGVALYPTHIHWEYRPLIPAISSRQSANVASHCGSEWPAKCSVYCSTGRSAFRSMHSVVPI